MDIVLNYNKLDQLLKNMKYVKINSDFKKIKDYYDMVNSRFQYRTSVYGSTYAMVNTRRALSIKFSF